MGSGRWLGVTVDRVLKVTVDRLLKVTVDKLLKANPKQLADSWQEAMNKLQVAKNRQEESTVGIVIAIEVVD